MYSVTILEASSPESRCGRTTLPLMVLGAEPSSLPPASEAPGAPWLVIASPGLCLHLHTGISSLSLCACYKDTCLWI